MIIEFVYTDGTPDEWKSLMSGVRRGKRRRNIKPLPIAIAKDWFSRDDVLRFPFKAVADSSNHSILCTTWEKLRERGCWCYHRQHTADNIRRLCSQQHKCGSVIKSTWKSYRNEWLGEQEQKRSVAILADDRKTFDDPRWVKITSKRHICCYENRFLSHES